MGPVAHRLCASRRQLVAGALSAGKKVVVVLEMLEFHLGSLYTVVRSDRLSPSIESVVADPRGVGRGVRCNFH